MTFPIVSTTPTSNRYYDYINKSRGIISQQEKIETEKQIIRAKVKRAVSECAIVASAVGLIYFGFKRSFRVDDAISATKHYEMVQKMEKPIVIMPLK